MTETMTATELAGGKPPLVFAPVKQVKGDARDDIEYSLKFRQQPRVTRITGEGEKAERRPIDPPPIVQLHVVHRPSPPPSGLSEAGPKANSAKDVDMDGGEGLTAEQKGKGREVEGRKDERGPVEAEEILEGNQYLQNPYYFMNATLVPVAQATELHHQKDGASGKSMRYTSGQTVSSLFQLKDIDQSDAGFFIFPDIGVKVAGEFRLKLDLYEIVGQGLHYCKTIFSDPFQVYAQKMSSKKTSGSDAGSARLSTQGVKVRLHGDDDGTAPTTRRVVSSKRKPSVDAGPVAAAKMAERKRPRTTGSLASRTRTADEVHRRHPSYPPGSHLPPPPPHHPQAQRRSTGRHGSLQEDGSHSYPPPLVRRYTDEPGRLPPPPAHHQTVYYPSAFGPPPPHVQQHYSSHHIPSHVATPPSAHQQAARFYPSPHEPARRQQQQQQQPYPAPPPHAHGPRSSLDAHMAPPPPHRANSEHGGRVILPPLSSIPTTRPGSSSSGLLPPLHSSNASPDRPPPPPQSIIPSSVGPSSSRSMFPPARGSTSSLRSSLGSSISSAGGGDRHSISSLSSADRNSITSISSSDHHQQPRYREPYTGPALSGTHRFSMSAAGGGDDGRRQSETGPMGERKTSFALGPSGALGGQPLPSLAEMMRERGGEREARESEQVMPPPAARAEEAERHAPLGQAESGPPPPSIVPAWKPRASSRMGIGNLLGKTDEETAEVGPGEEK